MLSIPAKRGSGRQRAGRITNAQCSRPALDDAGALPCPYPIFPFQLPRVSPPCHALLTQRSHVLLSLRRPCVALRAVVILAVGVLNAERRRWLRLALPSTAALVDTSLVCVVAGRDRRR